MKIKKVILVVLALASILSVGCSNGSTKNNSEKSNIESTVEDENTVDESNMAEIENNIPYMKNENGEIDEMLIDNSIIEKRYENVKKEKLTYDRVQYNYEGEKSTEAEADEREVITKIYPTDAIKNDVNYKSILNGFSYACEVNPCDITYDEALELVKKVLPDDIEKVKSVIDDEFNKEYIYYKSEKGNFRVGLSYGYAMTDEGEKVDKNPIVGIDYSREMD